MGSRDGVPPDMPMAERKARAVAGFLAAATAGVLPVYAKWHFLQGSTAGFLAISRLNGGSVPADLGLAVQLSFLSWDLLVSLLVLPLLVAAAGYWCSRRLGAAIVAGYCVATLLWSFTAMLTMSNVGRFPTPDMLAEAFGWVRSQPDFLAKYVSTRALLKLLGLAVLCGVAYAAGQAWIRRRQAPGSLVRLVAGEAALMLGVGAILLFTSGATAWRFRQAWPFQSLTLAEFGAELRLAGWPGSDGPLTGENAVLLQANACEADGSGIVGAARQADLVVIVLESVAAEVMERALEEGVLPGVARVREHALVATRHFTTHPFSSDAVFSLLTGRYSPGRRELVSRASVPLPDAIGTRLAGAGYQTSVYVPFLDRGGFDQPMYQVAGLQQLFVSEAHPAAVDSVLRTPPPSSRGARLWPGAGLWDDAMVRRRLAQDQLAWHRMVGDLEAAKRGGVPFASFILPQVGHGPWNDPGRPPREASMARLVLQDQWIGDLLDLLETRGWDSTTVLVVTADHGVRTRTEDPAIAPGQVSRYTFGVPLLIAAPGVWSRPVVVDHPTSHVDLVESLAGLLGLAAAREPGQGVPVWCPPSAERRILLLAEDYSGVNGILAGEDCLAYSRMTDVAAPCAAIGRPLVMTGPRAGQLREWLEVAPRVARHLNLDAVARGDPP